MIPSIQEIIRAVKTEEGVDNLISSFRTRTNNLTIEEAMQLKQQLDEEVGELVEQIQDAKHYAADMDDYELEDKLYELEASVVSSYGYDNYTDNEWINSDY